MEGKVVWMWIGLLCLLAGLVVNGYEQVCTYTAPNGEFYDFSQLSLCDNSGYGVNTDDGEFSINICNQVSGCDASSAICQSGGYSLGQATNYNFTSLPNGMKGAVLSYGAGDSKGGCPNNHQRSSSISLLCDPNAATPNVTFVQEKPACNYYFQITSKFACPVKKGPQIQNCDVYVYLVPHTHDDVGWLETVDGYYHNQVRFILNTMEANLLRDPNKRFIYVEMAYLWRWWNDVNTTQAMRNDFVSLSKRGQLEFVIGGWVMQDEACTTYSAGIDQLTLGHQFINDNFGAQPTKGWQIDPFGASSVTPTLYKLSGFTAHVIDRVTFKSLYRADRRMQFYWQGSPSLGQKAQIFTEVMDGNTNAYCDWYFTFNWNKDNQVNSGNIADFVNKFYGMVNDRKKNFFTPNVLAPWGCDFAFQNATPMFSNMDTIMNTLRAQESTTHVHVKYSTLSEYFDAVAAVPNIKYPVNHGGDFFPLDDSLYWTGYFTSRVELKGIVRQGEAISRVVEPLFLLSKIFAPKFDHPTAFSNISVLRRANGEAQHHDGVTGTSVPEVVLMFGNDILAGIITSLNSAAGILSNYISKGALLGLLTQSPSKLLSFSDGDTIPILVYNSLGWWRNDFLILSVNAPNIKVTDNMGATVPSQVSVNHNSNAPGKYNLFFQTKVPPVGFTTYFVTVMPPGAKDQTGLAFVAKEEPLLPTDNVISNGYLDLNISADSALLDAVTNKVSGIAVDVNQNLIQYTSVNGRSGAYAFGPVGPAVPIMGVEPQSKISKGPLVTEVYQVFTTGTPASWAKQTIRLYTTSNNQQNVSGFFDIDFELGVLPSHVEVSALFDTSLQTDQIFYTDDNGFEFVAREGQFNLAIEGNYYPTIYASYIKDPTAQLSLIFERSHGASAQDDGQLEVMVHRNPDTGDGFGPGLTDTTVVYPRVRVVVDSPAASVVPVRIQPYLYNFPLTTFLGPADLASTWRTKFTTTASFIQGALPLNVHFLSLYALDDSPKPVALFRLTHLFAVNEHPTYSKPVTINVQSLFMSQVQGFVETTATGNKVIDANPSLMVVLNPKDIRTFRITF